jgi:hypothetical protein
MDVLTFSDAGERSERVNARSAEFQHVVTVRPVDIGRSPDADRSDAAPDPPRTMPVIVVPVLTPGAGAGPLPGCAGADDVGDAGEFGELLFSASANGKGRDSSTTC